MAEVPLYNSVNVRTFVEYLQSEHPDVDVKAVLERSGISFSQLRDGGYWFTQKTIDSFFAEVSKVLDGQAAARGAGRYSANAHSSEILRQLAIGFITPSMAYWMMEKTVSSVTRHINLRVQRLAVNKIEILAWQKPGVQETSFQCDNRIGILEAIGKLFTGQYSKIDHPECIHRSAHHCRYIVTWEETSHQRWARAGRCLLLGGIVSFFPLAIWLPWPILGGYAAVVTLSVLGSFLRAQKLHSDELISLLEKQGDAAELLLSHMNTRCSESLLIRELGQASASIFDIKELLDFYMKSLEKRLDFGRGMILLANREKKTLDYAAGYGYPADQETYLVSTSFNLTKHNSTAPFIRAFREQQPVVINDIKVITKELSPRSRELAERLHVQSFLTIPIVYEGESLGVLSVDSISSPRAFNESDISLLMGIAHQIAISIQSAQTHRQIRESEERYRSLTESVPDLICNLDCDGRIIHVNRAWKSQLSRRDREAVGSVFSDFLTPSDEEFNSLLADVILKGDALHNYQLATTDITGKELLFLINIVPRFNAGGVLEGASAVLRDITEQRKLEIQLNQAAKMEALGRLTGGISHDFNNLLQVIGGYNQLLLTNKKPDDPDYKYLANISLLTKKAGDLVKQLLLFARKVETVFRQIDLNNEISNLKELLSSVIPKTIAIELSLTPDLRRINADSMQIQQIIMNLILNARDALPRGGEIIIATRNINLPERKWQQKFWIENGQYVELVFSDSGPGINRENLEHIFEPFFTTKEMRQGTGLGLSVVYGIVKNHGGYIWCESAMGVGTSFHLYFPAAVPGEKTADAQPGPRGAENGGRETILLVDDDEAIRETTAKILALKGYGVTTAASGEEALALYREKKDVIDLVVLDLLMPGMGGEKCLLELRKIDPEVKIIVSSGFSAHLSPDTLEKSGTVGFIPKPYDHDFFVEELMKALQG